MSEPVVLARRLQEAWDERDALQARLDAAEAERDKWETSFEKAADALDDTQRQLKRAEAVVEAAREVIEDAKSAGLTTYEADMRKALAAYDAARSGDAQ